MEWFNELELTLKIYWFIAIVATLIFVVQTIVSFVGGDVDADSGTPDFHADASFPFFSIRSLINFLLGLGWGGVCFYDTFASKTWVALAAIITGVALVLIFLFVFRQMMKLRRDNTFRIEETVGKTASVYLPIPSEQSGKGKIQISVRGAFHEIDAQTAGDRVATGDIVRVEKVLDSQTVLVAKQ